MNTLLDQACSLSPELKAWKDDLHRHPELSWHELRTTAFVREQLVAMGLELVDLGMDTGVVALLRGGKPGGTVALRADLDAIVQLTPETGETASENHGVMHACGHDFHTVSLLGAARLLCQRKAELSGIVVFLFQPAEETVDGAQTMVDQGLWEKLPVRPGWLFGLHNLPLLPTGKVAVVEGPLMAGKRNFTITLHGRTGHGGSPHKCVDVIVAGAALVNAIQSIVSRNNNPLEPLVCAVCSIHSGTAENFAADLLTMTGSVRALSAEAMTMACRRLEDLTTQIAAAYSCTAELTFSAEVPPLINGPEATALARRAVTSVLGADAMVCPGPDMGAEDFSVLGQTVPAFFYWLGSGFTDRENTGWHSACFRTNDDALPLGAALLAQSALEALG